jgi:hypothetical protein
MIEKSSTDLEGGALPAFIQAIRRELKTPVAASPQEHEENRERLYAALARLVYGGLDSLKPGSVHEKSRLYVGGMYDEIQDLKEKTSQE